MRKRVAQVRHVLNVNGQLLRAGTATTEDVAWSEDVAVTLVFVSVNGQNVFVCLVYASNMMGPNCVTKSRQTSTLHGVGRFVSL